MAENSPKDYFRTKKRYVEVGHLGRGGMADVSESKDEYFQRTIAYKKLKVAPNLKRKTEEFVREAMFMGMLEHPGILPIHELITPSNGETPAITMDKVGGLSMAQKISKAKKNPRSWPFDQRIRDFQKLVEIVAYSHSRHVVHRDIKPANVMFGSAGEVLLLDWGLAKLSSSKEAKHSKNLDKMILESANTVSGSIKGTPYYMSPEAAQGKSELVKESSDVYGLGALLYELMVLDYFIPGTKAIEVLRSAADSKHEPVDADALQIAVGADQKLSPELIYILQKSVEKERNRRYKDASLMNNDLLAMLAGLPVSGLGGPMSWYQISKWLKRNFIWFFLIGLPLLGILWMTSLFEGAKENLVFERNELLEKIYKSEKQLEKREKEISKIEKNIERLEQEALNKNDELDQWQFSDRATQEETLDQLGEDLEEAEDIKLSYLDKNLQLQEELTGYHLMLKRIEEDIVQSKQKIKDSQKIERYQEFMTDTFDYGLEIAMVRKAFDAGYRAEALERIRDSSILAYDPYVVDHWMKPLYASASQTLTFKKAELEALQSENVTLEPTLGLDKMNPILSEVRPFFAAKVKINMFSHPNGTETWFVSENGQVVLKQGGTFKVIHPHQATITSMVQHTSGWLVGAYDNGDIFVLTSVEEAPHVLHADHDKREIFTDGEKVYLKNNEISLQALRLEVEQQWLDVSSQLSPLSERSLPNTLPDVLDLGENLPPGYRLLHATADESLQLIGFLSSIKSKLRNFDPELEEPGKAWSLTRVKLKAVQSNGQQGWWTLTQAGDLFLLHPDHDAMQLFTDPEDPVERLFALQQKNLIIAQSESGQLWVYYLNTGQFLFSPGTLESPIQEIGVDMDQKLMFKTENGWKTTLF